MELFFSSTLSFIVAVVDLLGRDSKTEY